MNNELQHHGILGMKWGVRRYQNKDGSLTDAGRKRYNVDIEGVSIRMKEAKEKQAAALKEYNKKTFYGTFYDSRANSKLVKAQKNTELIKDELRTEKIKQRLNNETKKSNRRLKLEKKYKSKGMTEEEAAVAAYKRDKTEKILAATAGVTLTAVAAYVAYKHYDKTVDQFIKSGTILSRVTSNDNQSVKDAFYAAFNNTSDSKKYIGLYGDTLSSRGNDIFQKKIRVNQALKVASEKSAVKELDNLINKNPNFRNTLMSDLKKNRQTINIWR